MDLKNLSNAQLIKDTHRVIKVETTATVDVILRFREIHARELYLEHGYASLFEMATNLFGYDNASAQRRINAMKLMVKVPDLEARLSRKELCLQVAADIQTFLNLEEKLKRPYSKPQTEELVAACLSKSVLAVRRELALRNPKLKFRESKRFISEDRLEIRYSISVELDGKHNRLKQIWSHSNPTMTHEELIEKMTALALKACDPLQKMEKAEARAAKKSASLFLEEQIGEMGEIQLAVNFETVGNVRNVGSEGRVGNVEHVGNIANTKNLFPSEEVGAAQSSVDIATSRNSEEVVLSRDHRKRSRYISATSSREVLKRNENSGCVFVSASTGKRCGSKHFAQVDHIHEWSRGGSNEHQNLRIYCSAHNRWAWKNRAASVVRADYRAYA